LIERCFQISIQLKERGDILSSPGVVREEVKRGVDFTRRTVTFAMKESHHRCSAERPDGHGVTD
jgi:hypothetical protein